MIERVKDFIRTNGLIRNDEKLLVAVSGGVDSMVLLHVLVQLKYEVAVAHVNYQLRGSDSDSDEDLVRKTCKQLGVTFFCRKVDLAKSEESTQMVAREMRYEFFSELLNEHGFDEIVTAHHLNDSLETVIFNLSKGTGIAGLTGIAPLNGRVVRPLLCLTRSEIIQFAQAEELTWREDETNKESKYQRNLIRNEVIPKLEKLNPSLLNTFSSTLERMAGAHEVVELKVEEIRKEYVTAGEPIEINMKWMDETKKSLVLLSELLKEFGASYSLCKDIARCTESGKQFETPSHHIHYDRNKLLIQTHERVPVPKLIITGLGSFQWGEFSILVEEVSRENVELKSGDHCAHLDADTFSFPIKIRSWQPGDQFQPLGMAGTKMVSDLFIDEKVPVLTKKEIPIFAHKGEILWVGGYRIADNFKVTDGTKTILRLTISD